MIVWKLRSIISIFKCLLTTCECFPFLTISLFALSHSRKEELTQLKWKRPIIAHLQVAVKWTFHLAWNEKIIYRPITKKKGIMKKVWRFFSFFCLFFIFLRASYPHYTNHYVHIIGIIEICLKPFCFLKCLCKTTVVFPSIHVRDYFIFFFGNYFFVNFYEVVIFLGKSFNGGTDGGAKLKIPLNCFLPSHLFLRKKNWQVVNKMVNEICKWG